MFETGTIAEMRIEAASLAARYNWPEAARDLHRGVIPEGFGREVGSTIALFLQRPVISWCFFGGWSRSQETQYNQEMRAHARHLCRLRVLLMLLRRPQG